MLLLLLLATNVAVVGTVMLSHSQHNHPMPISLFMAASVLLHTEEREREQKRMGRE